MKGRSLSLAITSLAVAVAVILAGTGYAALKVRPGESIQVTVNEEIAEGAPFEQAAGLSEGGETAVSVGSAPTGSTKGGDPFCATNSDPSSGFTDTDLKFGTILPLSGALKPLGEQTFRVMKTASEVWLNSIPYIPGPYSSIKWGCSTRPGIFGRKIQLRAFSLQSNTDDEANAGMHRLIDVEKVFLVRDCYLQSNIMGPATTYQNQKGVPGVWCSYSGMPAPALAKWNFSPGTDPLKVTAIHVGWLIEKENKTRLAMLIDPTAVNEVGAVAERVAANLGHPIPKECIVQKKAQDAPTSERSEITALRNCYPGGTSPDAVIAFDALNGVFGPMEAKSQGWQVQWSCLTCWVQTLAELCGTACNEIITDCQALPCIPWADPNVFPAAKELETTRQKYLSRDPADILTYGPQAITGGLGLWLGMTGPNLSREALRNTLENLRNWDAGIGPILNTGPRDHYGGKSVWLIKFCGSQACDPEGRNPWFKDLTGNLHADGNGFVSLAEVNVHEEWTVNE